MLVRDRIIVLDDLERRDAALSLETLFGYVDALKGKGCTVLLIYNEEELSANQGKEWRAVREKCLDAEINLRPTPTDACELGLAPDCADRAAIQATALQLGLTNIRIIKRLERLTGTFRQLMSAQAAPCTAGFRGQQPGFLGALHCDTQLPADAVQRFLDDWATYSANQLSSKTAGDFVLPATRSGVSSDAELLRLLADFVLQQQLDASGVHARIQHLDARSRYANGQQAAVDYVDKASYDPTPRNRCCWTSRQNGPRRAGTRYPRNWPAPLSMTWNAAMPQRWLPRYPTPGASTGRMHPANTSPTACWKAWPRPSPPPSGKSTISAGPP